MNIRPLLFAGLLAATVVPAAAQDQYGSGYDDRAYGYGDRRAVRSTADFEAPLARYGRWVPSRFGRAWSPNVARDWRPYTVGHWVETADGETWESDEPWGWATYHYGRWGFDDRYGWVWVPDTEWAPAWVAWRDGDDYAGWAPLPPQGVYGSGYDDWDYDRWYAPSWVYVQRGNLYRRDLGRTVLPWRGNRSYWDRTRQQQHGWNGRDDRRDWSQRQRSGQPDRQGGAGWANRDRLRDAARFSNQPTRPDGNSGIVPPGGVRPGQVSNGGDRRPGWNGDDRRQDGNGGDRRPGTNGDARGQNWNGGARPGDNGFRGDRGQGTPPGAGTRPGQWQGRGGREVPPVAAVPNAGRERPVTAPVQVQPQARPPVQVQAPARPAAPPEARPQPQRPERPARADNPRRERDNKQPE